MGLFDSISNFLGLSNDYTPSGAAAGNPYSPEVLQAMLDERARIAGGQNQLASQLQAQAQGQGVNPAETQYLQNVQNNVANSQALLASQRGLNPALAARMASRAQAGANEQAASQASLLNQQQQLAAQQELAGLYGQEQQGNLAQQQLYVNPNTAANQTNAEIGAGNQRAAGNVFGGVLQGISGASTLFKAHGGMVEKMADGGAVQPNPNQMSFAARFLKGMGNAEMEGNKPQFGDLASRLNLKSGGNVPGQAKVKGDSFKNDTVPAMLSPKEIVLPRHVTMSNDAPQKAAKFVAAVLAKKRMKK